MRVDGSGVRWLFALGDNALEVGRAREAFRGRVALGEHITAAVTFRARGRGEAPRSRRPAHSSLCDRVDFRFRTCDPLVTPRVYGHRGEGGQGGPPPPCGAVQS